MSDYLKYWHIKANVFHGSETEDFFVSPSVAPLVHRLCFFCEQGDPLLVIVGEPGSGKSALLEFLHNKLPPKTHEVLLYQLVNPTTEAGWLWPRILQYFNKSTELNTDATRINSVLDCMDELIQEKRRITILIDDAHLLQDSKAYYDIELLMSLHTRARRSFSVVLAGQSSLSNHLPAAKLAPQLTLHADLEMWSVEDCLQYVRQRLQRAGLEGSTFTDQAIATAHKICKGNPAQLIAICENSMMEAFVHQKRHIDDALINRGASYVIKNMQANLAHQKKITPSPARPGADNTRPNKSASIKLEQLLNPKRTG